MALNDKFRRVLHSRYTPFFLPVIGSICFILLVCLLIPDEFGGSSATHDGDGGAGATAPVASGTNDTEASSKASARRRARLANRAAKKVAQPGALQPPAAAPPQPVPASPDGAE